MITYFSLTDLTDLTRSHARSTEISQDLLTWPDLTFNVWLTSDIWHLVLTLVTTDLLLWQHLTIFCLVPFATLAGQWQSPGGPGPAIRLPSKAFTFSSLPSSCREGLIQGPSMTSQVPQPTCYRSKLGSLTNQWQDLRYGKKKIYIYILIDWQHLRLNVDDISRCEKAEKAASQQRALPPAAFSLLHSGSIAFSS